MYGPEIQILFAFPHALFHILLFSFLTMCAGGRSGHGCYTHQTSTKVETAYICILLMTVF